MKRLFFFLLILFNHPVFSTLKVTIPCPDQLIAKLTGQRDISSQESQHVYTNYDFQVVKTNMANLSTGNSYTLKLLKYGPLNFIRGLTYKLSLRNGLVCDVTTYEKEN
ncbi:MAG: hypothetical protein H6622_11395 [Halobacteriovoraceae bacterium]|nr:hypothetical protein [Halobacteriovoraceae bacterium]